MEYTYKPTGVCSRLIKLELENDVVGKVEFTGGCAGNAQGLAALARGRNADELIASLKGINCGTKGTSCPDQLACALEHIKKQI